MDRRNFFRSMVGGVAAAAAVRTWPFRVFSFPTDLRIVNPSVAWTTASNVRMVELNVQALELESFAKEIPTLLANESIFYERIKHGPFRFEAVDPANPRDVQSAEIANIVNDKLWTGENF
jgi:hypothetical protein